MKMYRFMALAVVAGLFVAVTGFDRNGKDLAKTQAELTAVKAELVKAQASLTEVQKERDALKAELKKAEKQVPKTSQEMQKQLNAMADERDDAVARLTEYRIDFSNTLTQLQDQTQKVLILQQQVSDMQATINMLLDRLDGATVMPRPTFNGATTMPSPTM
jgi:uncharacterized protein YlxW (UPF0749 family)